MLAHGNMGRQRVYARARDPTFGDLLSAFDPANRSEDLLRVILALLPATRAFTRLCVAYGHLLPPVELGL